nr:hypothetical protein GCM10025730_18930 [Promicromonospora thailandica]
MSTPESSPGTDPGQEPELDPGTAEELEQERARAATGPVGDDAADTQTRLAKALQQTMTSPWTVSVGAVLLAIVAGSIMIAFTDEEVKAASTYFFARPGDTFVALGQAVGGAYAALFRGSVVNLQAPDVATALRPLTETLSYATPLIAAGLGVALAFRAGLFNIGGQGQMLVAAAAAGWWASA